MEILSKFLIVSLFSEIGGTNFERNAASMTFVTIGDSGEIGPDLYATGRGIAPYANNDINKFVGMVGDLSYPSGISSCVDPGFDLKFTEPFANVPGPFHPVLGDNDYEISKTVAADILVPLVLSHSSDKWDMPNFFYVKYYESFSGSEPVALCAVFIDTQSLIEIPFPNQMSEAVLMLLSMQMRWLEDTLGSERCQSSDFIIVFGHHAIVSGGIKIGKKGKGAIIGGILHDVFDRHFVDAYFAGHDHDLQGHFKKDCNTLLDHCMAYIVSGAASKLRKAEKAKFNAINGYDSWGVIDTIGFTVTYVWEDGIETVFVASATGEELYSMKTKSHRELRRGRSRSSSIGRVDSP